MKEKRVAVYWRDSREGFIPSDKYIREEEEKINSHSSMTCAGTYIDHEGEQSSFEKLMEAAQSGEVDLVEAFSMYGFADSAEKLYSRINGLGKHHVKIHFKWEDITTGTKEWYRCRDFMVSHLRLVIKETEIERAKREMRICG